MTIEQVLSFFDHHNTAIIEGLVAIIILFGLYLGYRGFFAKDEKHGGGPGMDTAELEKTLQKILENQASAPAGTSRHVRVEEHDSADDFKEMPREKTAPAAQVSEAAGGVGESPAEIEQLRLTLSESQKKIEVLQAQLAVAESKATEVEAAIAAAPAPASNVNSDLEGKVRDLEARLAEYEIISEDIADLSRFRDENEKLKAEIDVLKGQGGGSSAPPVSSSEEPVTAASVVPAPKEDAAPTDLAALDIDAAALIAEAEQTDTSAAAGTTELIDDDLMKEFAAAVEGQKALDKVGEKAGDGSTQAEKKSDENSELMNEFENFVSKKS
ncbi:MAG: hypothetical protein ACM3MG_10125 [Bacillota bacterium]